MMRKCHVGHIMYADLITSFRYFLVCVYIWYVIYQIDASMDGQIMIHNVDG